MMIACFFRRVFFCVLLFFYSLIFASSVGRIREHRDVIFSVLFSFLDNRLFVEGQTL